MNYPDWLRLVIPDLLAMNMPMRWEFAREVGKGKKRSVLCGAFWSWNRKTLLALDNKVLKWYYS